MFFMKCVKIYFISYNGVYFKGINLNFIMDLYKFNNTSPLMYIKKSTFINYYQLCTYILLNLLICLNIPIRYHTMKLI